MLGTMKFEATISRFAHGACVLTASAVVGAAVCLTAAGAARAQQLDLQIMPPDFDYGRICKASPGPKTDPHQLTAWQSGDPGVPSSELLDLGDLYREGSPQTPSNAALAQRIYEHLAQGSTREAASAKVRLADMLLDAETGVESDRRAAGLLRAAAQTRSGSAAYKLGLLYEEGRGVPRDFAAAAQFYKLAAVEGQHSAAFALARLYADELVEPPTPGAAAQMAQLGLVGLIAAANSGQCSALVDIGRYYERGDALRQDQRVASAWYLAAAQAGDLRGMREIARRYAGGEGVKADMTAAVRWWSRAAENGLTSAAAEVGSVYATGKGVPADADKAVYWLERAAAGGSAQGMRLLAELWSGELPAQPREGVNYELAVQWYERALKQDPLSLGALNALADAYLTGRGVAADPARAYAFRTRAAEAGSLTALRKLAEANLNGQGVGTNPTRALQLFRQAALRGDSASFGNISAMYRCGIGVSQDVARAELWAQRAAAYNVQAFLIDKAEELLFIGTPEALAERRIMLLRAAAGDNRKAIVALAETYAAGWGVEPDPEEVERWKALAVAKGDAQAEGMRVLALAMLDEGPLSGDTEAAVALLKQAADLGDAQAGIELGRLYARGGPGAMPDPALSLQYFNLASTEEKQGSARAKAIIQMEFGEAEAAVQTMAQTALAGDLQALVNLAEWLAEDDPRVQEIASGYPPPAVLLDEAATPRPCDVAVVVALAEAYADGVAGDERRSEAYDWIDFALTAFSPRPDRLRRLGEAAFEAASSPEQQARGIELMTLAAERGSVRAMLSLYKLHLEGDKTPVDLEKAGAWLLRAAEAGDAEALYRYAETLASGLIWPADEAKARAYMERAADAGDSRAKRVLAKWHLVGLISNADPQVAVKLLEEAIALGDVEALIELANIYTVGLVTPPDPSAAIRLLQRAAEAGNGEAMLRLSVAYASGFGVALDRDKANYWMKAATAAGSLAAAPEVTSTQ